MRYTFIACILILFTLASCRKDFSTIPNKGNLEFSKKTVYLDTVFTNVSSSTYMLKVYNRSNDDITIPSISLGKGNNSKYRISVDGRTGVDADNNGIGDGKVFSNVELLANDSLFVFIEATAGIADANPTDLLYTDEIVFDGGQIQKVNLVTLIQDAIFLYPERYSNGNGGYTYENLTIGSNPPTNIYGFFLTDTELHFTKTKPYVIYGFAAVPSNKTLIIDAGTRVHFHDGAGIIVANNGSIQVNGTPSPPPPPSPLPNLMPNEVIFEGDRLEPEFSEIPGQWAGILMTIGSKNNSFNHLTLKNSTFGLYVQGQEPTSVVQIKNTQIYNSSFTGILTRNAKIDGENIVINKAGKYAMACTIGGTYNFKHCTFANYWTGSSRQTPAVLLSNFLDDGTTVTTENMTFNIFNSIVYGPNNIEFSLNKGTDVTKTFTSIIQNCLIKFNDPTNQFGSSLLYTTFLNDTSNLFGNSQTPNDPKFKNTTKNQLNILSGSSVIGKGKNLVTPLPDILNNNRPLIAPDLGAYQF